MTRLGPRPLPLHLASATGFYMSCLNASAGLSSGSIPWHPKLKERAEALQSALERRLQPEKAPPESQEPNPSPDLSIFPIAVEAEARRRLSRMMDGIQAYRAHPYRRDLPEPDVLWREGTTRVLDYRKFRVGKPRGQPALLIPSLVNRGYILDLSEGTSLARWLAEQGFDVFLVDWDAPGSVERGFDLTAYIARLNSAAEAVSVAMDRRALGYVGYCMGGLLALAAAARAGDGCASLSLLATPWDFHAEQPDHARMLGSFGMAVEPLLQTAGELPVDVLQSLFAGIDPFLGLNKFMAFAAMEPSSGRARAFVALEDWLNDGVPLAGPVARECLCGWYGENTPAQDAWEIAGERVRPEAFDKPTLALIPAGDRIVPPASALALADRIPRCETLMPKAGHIGMVSGSRRVEAVWEPLRVFLTATS